MKRKKAGNIFAFILSILAIIGIPLLTASVMVSFDFSQLLTMEYATRWALLQSLSMVAYQSLIGFRRVSNMEIPEYAEKEAKIKGIIYGADIDFQDFIEYYNRKNKKRSYLAKQNLKIINLRERMTEVRNTRKLTNRKQRKVDNLNKRIEDLKEITTPEYVEENIDFIKVDYPIISRNHFLSDGKIKDKEEFIISSNKFYTKAFVKKFFKGMLNTTLLTAVVVTGSMSGGTPNIIYNILMPIASAAWMAYAGNKKANTEYQDILIPNQVNRLAVLKEYGTWRGDKNGKA